MVAARVAGGRSGRARTDGDAVLSIVSRRSVLVRALILIFLAFGGFVVPAQTQAAAPLVGPKEYYLALGTSISFGWEPNWDWSHGYTDQWYSNVLRARGVTNYTNYACPGDTTYTMIHGGCQDAQWQRTPYSGPQLAAGVSFLNAHKGQVSPVTLDMGIVEFLPDINSSSCVIPSTLPADLAAIDSNLVNTILPQITGAMKNGQGVMTGDLFMMNYYDPYQNQCANTVPVVQQLNQHLAADAALFPGVRVIDVFTAFGGAASPNQHLCSYTWWCATHLDAHPTGGQGGEPGNGYGAIANAFQAATYGAPQPPTTGTITGQVTDASTSSPVQGIAGATVSLANTSLTATTDSSGTYTLNGVPAGPQSVGASATGYTPSGSQSVTVAAGQTSTANFSLTPTAGTVKGTVNDVISGLPIGGASLTIGGVSTTTDGSGSYTLGGIAPGTGTVSAQVVATYYQPFSSTTMTVNLGAQTQNFTLTPTTGTISGTVSLSGGGGVSVTTVSAGGVTTTSGTGGAYTLVHVPVGSSVSVSAGKTGYDASAVQVVAVTAGGTTGNINFTLTPQVGTISGTVSDTSNAPLSGVTVSAGGVTTTTSNGTYTLSNVPAGTQTVAASKGGYSSAQTTVTVPDQGSVVAPTLQLAVAAGTLSGTVTVRGRAASGATVTLTGNGLSRTTTTDGSGHYQFTSVPAGTCTARASVYGGWIQQTQSVTVSGGTTTLNFAM